MAIFFVSVDFDLYHNVHLEKLRVSIKFQVEILKEMSEQALLDCMNPQMAISAFISARQLGCKESAIEFIVR